MGVVEKILTIKSKWLDWETEREMFDSNGNPVKPVEVEEVYESRKGICWYCKGAGWFQDSFATAGRIKAIPCPRCKGTGRFYSGSVHFRVNAVFRFEKGASLKSRIKIRRVDKKNEREEVYEYNITG